MLNVKKGVRVAIRDLNGNVLLLRRSADDKYPGSWELPGGAIEEGEEPKRAALREVFEEAHIRLNSVRLWQKIERERDGKKYTLYLFTTKNTKRISSLSKKHNLGQWFSPANAITLPLAPGSAYAIHKMMRTHCS